MRGGLPRHGFELVKRCAFRRTTEPLTSGIQHKDNAPGSGEIEVANHRWRRGRRTVSTVNDQTARLEQTDAEPGAFAAPEDSRQLARRNLSFECARYGHADCERQLCT